MNKASPKAKIDLRKIFVYGHRLRTEISKACQLPDLLVFWDGYNLICSKLKSNKQLTGENNLLSRIFKEFKRIFPRISVFLYSGIGYFSKALPSWIATEAVKLEAGNCNLCFKE